MPPCRTTAGCFSGKEGRGVCLHVGQRPGVCGKEGRGVCLHVEQQPGVCGKEGRGVCLPVGQRPGVLVVRKCLVYTSMLNDNGRVF